MFMLCLCVGRGAKFILLSLSSFRIWSCPPVHSIVYIVLFPLTRNTKHFLAVRFATWRESASVEKKTYPASVKFRYSESDIYFEPDRRTYHVREKQIKTFFWLSETYRRFVTAFLLLLLWLACFNLGISIKCVGWEKVGWSDAVTSFLKCWFGSPSKLVRCRSFNKPKPANCADF